MGPSAPANSLSPASTITVPTQNGLKGCTSTKGRYSAASETTSVSSLRKAPSRLCWWCSRASMPSMALKAMRTNIQAGISPKAASEGAAR